MAGAFLAAAALAGAFFAAAAALEPVLAAAFLVAVAVVPDGFLAGVAAAARLVAGLDFAELDWVVADLAAFFAGGLAVLVLRAFEDTNTSRQRHRGAARPGNVKSRVVIVPRRR